MAIDSLRDLALKAVKELKESGEWKAKEDGLACFTDHEPGEVTDNSTVRALVMFILRGESPQGIYAYFEIKPTVRRRRPIVEEIKSQIREHFLSDDRYDWPAAFGITEFREKLPRTFSDWSPDEEFCYAAMKGKGKSREELAEIFQRAPGAALVPPHAIGAVTVETDSAIHLLGVEVRCVSCYHSTPLTYAILAHAAKKSGAEVKAFSKSVLEGVLGQFKCKRCGTKGPRLKVEG